MFTKQTKTNLISVFQSMAFRLQRTNAKAFPLTKHATKSFTGKGLNKIDSDSFKWPSKFTQIINSMGWFRKIWANKVKETNNLIMRKWWFALGRTNIHLVKRKYTVRYTNFFDKDLSNDNFTSNIKSSLNHSILLQKHVLSGKESWILPRPGLLEVQLLE